MGLSGYEFGKLRGIQFPVLTKPQQGTFASARDAFNPDDSFEAEGPLGQERRHRVLENLDSPLAPVVAEGHFGSALRFNHNREAINTTWLGVGELLSRTISFGHKT